MSSKAVGKGKALLEALGLTRSQRAQCYSRNPGEEVEAIQEGLEDWIGSVDPTWGDLLTAMETAEISIQDRNDLKKRLSQ